MICISLPFYNIPLCVFKYSERIIIIIKLSKDSQMIIVNLTNYQSCNINGGRQVFRTALIIHIHGWKNGNSFREKEGPGVILSSKGFHIHQLVGCDKQLALLDGPMERSKDGKRDHHKQHANRILLKSQPNQKSKRLSIYFTSKSRNTIILCDLQLKNCLLCKTQ